MNTILVDWSVYNEKWINHGRTAIEEACKHKTEYPGDTNMYSCGWCEECGLSEDSAQPMMNYAYELEGGKPDTEKILRVVKETNLTVMENDETGE